MLRKIAQIAQQLDEIGLHAQADALTNVMERMAFLRQCPACDTEYTEEGWATGICDTCGYEDLDEDRIAMASKKKKPRAPLNKPFRTPNGPKKFSVYVKNDKGNIVKVNFGDPDRSIKRDQPERLKNFRARHNCDEPGPKWKAKYWACKTWEKNKSVTDILKGK